MHSDIMKPQNEGFLKGIRLVLIDIEGTLVPGKDISMLPEHWDLIKRIAGKNRKFLIGLNTGRDVKYAARFSELLGEGGMILGESGGQIYDCDTGTVTIPIDTRKLELLEEAEQILDGHVMRVKGTKEKKTTMLSYNPPTGMETHAFSEELEAVLMLQNEELKNELEFTFSQSAVDITCKGVNKGTGVLRLAEMLGIPVSQIAVIGDGMNNLMAFVTVAAGGGVCVAPSNAMPEVKDYLNHVIEQGKPAYISEKPSTEAVIELLFDVLKQTDATKAKEKVK